jgi:capsular exopolysaccharide synthesis family protein
VIRGIVRALLRQRIWAGAGALAVFLTALLLLPSSAPSARARISPEADALWRGIVGASPEAAKLQPRLRFGAVPGQDAVEVQASKMADLETFLALLDREAAGRRHSELQRLLAETLDLRGDRDALQTRLLKASRRESRARLLEELRREERELAEVGARLDRLAQRIERNEASAAPGSLDTRESDLLSRDLLEARRQLQELSRRSPAEEASLSRAQARVEELRARHAVALNRETLVARFAPVRSMIDETRELFGRRQRLLDAVHWRRGELELLEKSSPEEDADPARLQAELDALDRRLAGLEDRRQELEHGTAPATGRLLGAEPGGRPVWAWALLLLASAAGGLLTSSVRESLCGTIRTQHDVVRYLNLPLLGLYPKTPSPILLQGSPEPYVEAFRSSALLVEARLKELGTRLLAVTSPGKGDGKSTVASSLAVTLARNGLRVLLVDADLRRPRQHRLFGAANDSGLSTYLSGEAEALDTLLVATEVENLVLLPAGPPLDNPPAWFRSERFQALCRDLRGWYDLTLVDLPPVAAAAEALGIGSLADGILLVAGAGLTGKDEVTEAKRLIRGSGGKLWGCVLNRTALKSRGYEYYSAGPADGARA